VLNVSLKIKGHIAFDFEVNEIQGKEWIRINRQSLDVRTIIHIQHHNIIENVHLLYGLGVMHK
jgi:hypothetical protein